MTVTEQQVVLTLIRGAGTADGYPPDSEYARRFWIPVLGPTAVVVGALLVEAVDAGRDEYPLVDLAERAGIGNRRNGNSGPARRSIQRLSEYGMARPSPQGLIVVPVWPLVSARYARRFSHGLRSDLETWTRT